MQYTYEIVVHSMYSVSQLTNVVEGLRVHTLIHCDPIIHVLYYKMETFYYITSELFNTIIQRRGANLLVLDGFESADFHPW